MQLLATACSACGVLSVMLGGAFHLLSGRVYLDELAWLPAHQWIMGHPQQAIFLGLAALVAGLTMKTSIHD